MSIQLLDTTITGLGAGGLPAGTVTSSSLAASGRLTCASAARTSGQTLNGDSGWQDHLSVSFTCGVACRILMILTTSIGYESNTQGFFRFLVDGSKVGYNFQAGMQSDRNSAGAGSGSYWADVSAGSHTVMVQARNVVGTWITPYYSVDSGVANTLAVLYYA
jgi:hypothetical protein